MRCNNNSNGTDCNNSLFDWTGGYHGGGSYYSNKNEKEIVVWIYENLKYL